MATCVIAQERIRRVGISLAYPRAIQTANQASTLFARAFLVQRVELFAALKSDGAEVVIRQPFFTEHAAEISALR